MEANAVARPASTQISSQENAEPAKPCATCDTATVCKSCIKDYTLQPNFTCKIAFNTQAFIWSTEIIHDQLFCYTNLNLTDEARYNYISSIAKDSTCSTSAKGTAKMCPSS
jgi:hypothetical protein